MSEDAVAVRTLLTRRTRSDTQNFRYGCISSFDLTSVTPRMVRAAAIALVSSSFDFTLPDSVTTPWAVSTSIVDETSCALSSAVLTRSVIVWVSGRHVATFRGRDV